MTSLPLLYQQACALVEGEPDWIANCANLSALIFNELPQVNFAGVYRYENGELILGPFQGKPACIHIPLGKGVCGTAAETKKIQIVSDVHRFKGHIACDEATRSELVVPIWQDGKLWGVFDLDSPILDRFKPNDARLIDQIATLIWSADQRN